MSKMRKNGEKFLLLNAFGIVSFFFFVLGYICTLDKRTLEMELNFLSMRQTLHCIAANIKHFSLVVTTNWKN